MKQILFIIIAVFILSGCSPSLTESPSTIMKDCSSDNNCFADAALKCSLAKIVTIFDAGTANEIRTQMEIRGGTKYQCKVYTKYLKFGPNPELEGKDMECVIPIKDSYSISHSDEKSCTGPLVAGLIG